MTIVTLDITLAPEEFELFNAYLEAIDFTETGDTDQPSPGTELDQDFYRESMIDCLAFYSRARSYLSDDNLKDAGHDFWLTRNGHGTGFWDRSETYGEFPSEYLTKVAESFGEVYTVFETEL